MRPDDAGIASPTHRSPDDLRPPALDAEPPRPVVTPDVLALMAALSALADLYEA